MKIETEGSFPLFLFFSSLYSVFLAFAALSAKQGNTVNLFFSILATWTGYMFSHKIAEGSFVDGKEPSHKSNDKDDKMTPKDLAENTGFLIGTGVFTSGMIIGALGVRSLEFPLTLLGAGLFNSGYIIAHWSTTGKLL